jgi:hypothetical protein
MPSPLEDNNVLERVLGYVGRGQWLFVAGVSRLWREKYELLVAGESRETTYRAAWATVARYELFHAVVQADFHTPAPTSAYFSKADLVSVRGQRLVRALVGQSLVRALGRWASGIDVILFAKELVEKSTWETGESVCLGAAAEGRLSLLRQLHLEHDFPLCNDIVLHAVKAPTPEVLSWLWSIKDQGWNENPVPVGELFEIAAAAGRIENAQWLRDNCHFTEWPEDTIRLAAQNNELAFIKWARAKGCSWGAVNCVELETEIPTISETWEWLHEQPDYPCVCTDDEGGAYELDYDLYDEDDEEDLVSDESSGLFYDFDDEDEVDFW